MSYSERLIITVPADLADIASAIGRALDPDVGGEHSFHDNGDGTITVDTPCIPKFKQDAEFLMQHPELLHWKVMQDYASRWVELTSPTLKECQAFCAGIISNIEVQP
ncbi:MAG TPA: hypothetical protein VIO56_06720 [Methylotenera sp.]